MVCSVVLLAVGAVVGVANSIIVTRLHIDPVIGTLAMSAILAAVTYWVASGQSILYGFDPSFVRLGSSEPLGVPFTLIILIVLAAVLWFVLEQELRPAATSMRLALIPRRPGSAVSDEPADLGGAGHLWNARRSSGSRSYDAGRFRTLSRRSSVSATCLLCCVPRLDPDSTGSVQYPWNPCCHLRRCRCGQGPAAQVPRITLGDRPGARFHPAARRRLCGVGHPT